MQSIRAQIYTFEELFDILINHEGGYVNDPNDPGGETKFGISKNSYPNLDIKNLTLDAAKEIYRRDFWERFKIGEFPPTLRHDVFDFAVNSGGVTAIRQLQRILGIVADGVVGPLTLQAIANSDPMKLEKQYLGSRLQFMTKLRNWPNHGRGWASRIADLLMAD